MAIYRKKGNSVWYAEVYLKERGRSVCFSTKKRDEAEAREVERAFRLAHNRSVGIDKLHGMLDALFGDEAKAEAVGISLANAYDRYAELLKTTGRQPNGHTMAARRRAVVRLVEWRDRAHPACLYMGEVTRSVAGRFAAEWNALPGLSDKTKHDAIADLGAVWNALMAVDETIRENPWRHFLKAVRVQNRGAAFTPDEERRILRAAEGSEWHTACVVSRWTGLRFGDVCALRWEDVDWGAGLIRLEPNKTRQHRITVTLPMSKALKAELSPLRQSSGAVVPVLSRYYPYPEDSPCGPFRAILDRAGIIGHRFHDFRHTFASRLADAGVGTEIIKLLGGWTVDATAQRYQHSDRLGELRSAIRAAEARQR